MSENKVVDKNSKLKKIYKKNSRTIKITAKALLGIFIIIFVYTVGLNVGNGTIQFKNGSLISFGATQNKQLPKSLDYQQVQAEYNIIKQNFDGNLSGSSLQYGVQSGLANATGDPYTEFFNPTQAKALNNELNDTFTGIGAQLSKNSNGQVIVMSPLAGYPAQKAGLLTNDIILSVNGKDVTNQDVGTVVNDIRGPAGSTVKIVVQRNGVAQPITYSITRSVITAPSVEYKIINGNIGYMQVTSFAADTPTLTQQAADMFKKNNVKGVVLDLRDDPGGLVTSAVSVSSLWLPSGATIMIEKQNNIVTQTYTANGNNTLSGVPTVVLINGGSASASEITAGALKDNKVATLVGQQSFGKGSVQGIFGLAGGSEVKVTLAHWFTPSDISITHKGITPDVIVAPGAGDQLGGTDAQLDAATKYLQTH